MVSLFQGDALTWWRTYVNTHGGISGAYSNLTIDVLFDELTAQFQDIDKPTRLRD